MRGLELSSRLTASTETVLKLYFLSTGLRFNRHSTNETAVDVVATERPDNSPSNVTTSIDSLIRMRSRCHCPRWLAQCLFNDIRRQAAAVQFRQFRLPRNNILTNFFVRHQCLKLLPQTLWIDTVGWKNLAQSQPLHPLSNAGLVIRHRQTQHRNATSQAFQYRVQPGVGDGQVSGLEQS